MITAIIAAITSVVISLLTLYQSLRNQKQQMAQFAKGQNRALTTKLYDLRLQYYPPAFEITEWLQRTKGNNLDHLLVFKVKNEIKTWKAGVVSLIISYEAMQAFLDFKNALTKQPGHGNTYTPAQVEKIWKARSELRRQLRKDIGLLHNESHIDIKPTESSA